MKIKYFLDTEFIENGKTIDLISIGIACEDNRTLYLQNSECDFSKASDWVWRNVFPHLKHFDMRGKRSCRERKEHYDSGLGTRAYTQCSTNPNDPCPWANRSEIRDAVYEFCNVEKHGKPEFWGYYADYDWVVFCQLFGSMIALPNGFPMYCRDLKQFIDYMGNPRVETSDIHHALNDAEWIMETHSKIASLPRP